MRAMITGGGTGGHTSPAIAIIEELRRRHDDLAIEWVGKTGAVEERCSHELGIPFRAVPAEGWPRGSHLRKLLVGAKLAIGILAAARHLTRFRPDVVVGVGGYVSIPLVWAAQRLGTPTVLHEQNKRLGLANRFLAKRATRLLLSYEETDGVQDDTRPTVVGNPVRAGFLTPPSRTEAAERLGLDPSIPTVLIVGGSQGAHTLNHAISQCLPNLGHDELQLLWMTGKKDEEAARRTAENSEACVKVYAYIDDMVTAYVAADLVVSRAGASSTAELAALGKPAILVPYPFATDNHQEANAQGFAEKGAAIVISDDDCTGEALLAALRGLLQNQERLRRMGAAAKDLAHLDAGRIIVDEIVSVIENAAR